MRTLIACVVALSIPLQGLAATVMTHCMPVHTAHAGHAAHSAAYSAVHSAAESEQAGQQDLITGEQHSHDNGAHHAPHVRQQSHESADDSSPRDGVGCAVCCAALITQGTVAFEPMPVGTRPVAQPVSATPDRYSGGIERPPPFMHA